MLDREDGAAGGIKLFTDDFFRSLLELLVLGEVLRESPSLVTWICTGSSGILITVKNEQGMQIKINGVTITENYFC